MPRTPTPTIRQIEQNALHPLQSWVDIFLIEPIAVRVVWLLLRWAPRTTPNMVTGSSFLCAVLSAFFFFHTEYLLGALVYQLFYVLDNVDGILARFTKQTSRLGASLDGLNNVAAYGLNLSALFLGIAEDPMIRLVWAALLVIWALHLEMGKSLGKPENAVWANFVPSQDSLLRRNRLLFPLSFPDRHFLLFVVGPLAGLTIVCGFVVLALDVVSLLVKVYRLSSDNGKVL